MNKIYLIFIILLFSGCNKDFTLMDLTLYNENKLNIYHLELKITNKSYFISNLKKKTSIKVKIYSDTSIEIKFCLNKKLIHLKNLGYYTNNLYKRIETQIFFYENSLVINNLNDKYGGSEYKYNIVGKCN